MRKVNSGAFCHAFGTAPQGRMGTGRGASKDTEGKTADSVAANHAESANGDNTDGAGLDARREKEAAAVKGEKENGTKSDKADVQGSENDRTEGPKAQGTDTGKQTAAGNAANERTTLSKSLSKTRSGLEKKLAAVEADVAKLEEAYISDTWAHGNALRGWDGYVRRVATERGGNGSGFATGAPKTRKSRPTDRIFSLCSSSSVIRKELDAAAKKGPGSKKKKKR